MGRGEGVAAAAAASEHALGIGPRGTGAVASAGLPTMMLDDHGGGTVGGIGGPIGELLETNQGILLQFKDNMRLYKVRPISCLGYRPQNTSITLLCLDRRTQTQPPTHPLKMC